MKNVSLEMNNEALNVVAGLFDIEVEGVEKEALVEKVNAAIEDLKSGKVSRAKAKWFEVEGANPYVEGDVVKVIAGDGLIGRFCEVISPSSKKDAVKAFLLNPTTGERQGTLITMDFFKIEKSEFVAKAPKVTKKEETTTTEASSTEETAQESSESQTVEEEVIEASENTQESEEQSEVVEEEAVV
jgi:hypothetical protein